MVKGQMVKGKMEYALDMNDVAENFDTGTDVMEEILFHVNHFIDGVRTISINDANIFGHSFSIDFDAESLSSDDDGTQLIGMSIFEGKKHKHEKCLVVFRADETLCIVRTASAPTMAIIKKL